MSAGGISEHLACAPQRWDTSVLACIPACQSRRALTEDTNPFPCPLSRPRGDLTLPSGRDVLGLCLAWVSFAGISRCSGGPPLSLASGTVWQPPHCASEPVPDHRQGQAHLLPNASQGLHVLGRHRSGPWPAVSASQPDPPQPFQLALPCLPPCTPKPQASRLHSGGAFCPSGPSPSSDVPFPTRLPLEVAAGPPTWPISHAPVAVQVHLRFSPKKARGGQ